MSLSKQRGAECAVTLMSAIENAKLAAEAHGEEGRLELAQKYRDLYARLRRMLSEENYQQSERRSETVKL